LYFKNHFILFLPITATTAIVVVVVVIIIIIPFVQELIQHQLKKNLLMQAKSR
jgi:phosphotransferase system  glucose/maltose/N-acetylglucosamine-specific IIC component